MITCARSKAALCPILSIVLALAAAPGRAQEASGAQLAYERGAQLYAERKLDQAVEAFLDSYRLVPNANVAFNIAQTCALLGRYDEAFNWYQTHLGFELDVAAKERAQQRVDALTSKVAVVDVRSRPAGAALFVDRVELGSFGMSPRRLALLAGEHVVIARLPGYEQVQATVEVKTGSTIVIEPELLPSTGIVAVVTQPSGARVMRASDGQVLGETPISLHVAPGAHALVLVLEGHLTRRVEVQVERGRTSTVRNLLERDPMSIARLSVSGEPGGEVFLDGRYFGAVPTRALELAPGRHALEVRHGAAQPWAASLDLPGGTQSSLHARAEHEGRDGIGAYRWLGYGVAGAFLITAGAVGLAALNENERIAGMPGASVDGRDRLNLIADLSLGAAVLTAGVTLALDFVLGSPERSRIVVERSDIDRGD